MDSGIALLAGLAGGALLGVFVDRWAGHRSADQMSTEPTSTPPEPEGVPSPNVPEGMRRVLAVLPGAALVVGSDNVVLRASPEAANLGMSQGVRVDIPEIVALVAQVRRDGVIREEDLELRRPPLGRVAMHARVRVAPLSATAALVLIEDHSDAFRVDAVRRDFVANVSHELKTPVGALSLLAEAVQSAPDDHEAVERFSARMLVESQRLTNLVNDLIDLSRLQSDDPLKDSKLVEIDHVIAEAVDSTKLIASSRDIDVVVGAPVDTFVQGDEGQLVMAIRNLLSNAVAYSPPGTRVAVAARVRGGVVEIDVTDQGIGIPDSEQSRIFERFYRVDPARSRQTGGTGLGLAIVKHVCVNHGGECTVWSVQGEGSTFTLRLPVASTIGSLLDVEEKVS
ncbi:MAG: ATP-binding protein [Actinomycetes bacterium]